MSGVGKERLSRRGFLKMAMRAGAATVVAGMAPRRSLVEASWRAYEREVRLEKIYKKPPHELKPSDIKFLEKTGRKIDFSTRPWLEVKENLPESVDWSAISLKEPLGQGPLGDCTHVATMVLAHAEFARAGGEGADPRYLEGDLHTPEWAKYKFNPAYTAGNVGEYLAGTISTCKSVVENGVCPNSIEPDYDTVVRDYPVTPPYPTDAQREAAKAYRASDWFFGPVITANGGNDPEDVFAFLSQRPAVFGFPLFRGRSMYDGGDLYTPTPDDVLDGYHAFYVYGYDKDRGIFGRDNTGRWYPYRGSEGRVYIPPGYLEAVLENGRGTCVLTGLTYERAEEWSVLLPLILDNLVSK